MGLKRFAKRLGRSIAKRLPATSSPPAEKAKPAKVKPVAAGNRNVPDHVPFIVPEAKLSDIFAGADQAEVVMLPRLIRSHRWAMPEHELLTLGGLIKMLQPKMIVEFGTFMGGSTLTMAANMPADGRIVTIDLDPGVRTTHVHGQGVGLSNFDVGCLFQGTRYESQIEQRFANTIEFTDHDLLKSADLVFVDADHTYEFVKRDTQTALTFVKPGAALLWHDYTWEPDAKECVGVTQTVNEFWEEHGGCRQIAGTRFAVHLPQLVDAAEKAAA
ncbi:O-methyltransferase [Blastopirellula retiformator]|uniref:O-methyltransferase n=1 Tax=Blastopirellula retiformator TaxID=2527970 RepID=A0A5C5UZE8_9BACT|nr:class I SAM-dependent methyltransferase [Blastopirellula retiformator]TWT30857.1 O-methyltransferase [Blastopirellula retiformator]